MVQEAALGNEHGKRRVFAIEPQLGYLIGIKIGSVEQRKKDQQGNKQ
jgi:hypothetical protein